MVLETVKDVEIKEKAKEGVYLVTLTKIQEEVHNGFNMLVFYFREEKLAFQSPDNFTLFDLPLGYSQKDYETFCYRWALIKRCFGIEGKFTQLNYEMWQGAKGQVRIGKQKNGYMGVTEFIPRG
ncbi:MAG: hypothetical protein ACI4VW_08670 [Acutalibacteraceae bacterium]